MKDSRMRELLTELADEVNPGDHMQAIRARTRRPSSHRWASAGVALVVASMIVGAVLTTRPDQSPSRATSPASTTSASPVPTTPTKPTETETTPNTPRTATHNVEVYYVGDTPDGKRLFPEFRRVEGADPFRAATAALQLSPQSPNRFSLWPPDAIARVHFDGIGRAGLIQVVLHDESTVALPGDMTRAESRLAVEQVIRTLQAAAATQAPVQFFLDGSPVDQVLGFPASKPFTLAPDLDVLGRTP